MTKWGRKKKNTSSSSTSNHVFLKSLVSKLKNTKGGTAARPDQHQPQSNSDIKINSEEEEDDAFYWRLSFDKEEIDQGFKILSSTSDHKLNVSPIGYGSWIFDGTEKKEFEMEGFQDYGYLVQDSNKEDQNHRKSLHIRSNNKHGGKVDKDPTTDGKMIKDMKKPWMNIKKQDSEVEDAFLAGLDSFAVVKTSYDPHKDFRESMMEMIMEKQLRKPEELEELLACYLTLNCDGLHDLIVDVFRQVWFQLNQLHFDQDMEFSTSTD